jgi:hypothetical protein
MKGSGFGFDDLWGEGADASPLISEVATEKALSAQVKLSRALLHLLGLNFHMNTYAHTIGSLIFGPSSI